MVYELLQAFFQAAKVRDDNCNGKKKRFIILSCTGTRDEVYRFDNIYFHLGIYAHFWPNLCNSTSGKATVFINIIILSQQKLSITRLLNQFNNRIPFCWFIPVIANNTFFLF